MTPSKSYEYMWDLIYRNMPPSFPFSLELVMAICWEESMFNNQEQVGGTAWGFGQVEPAEYDKFIDNPVYPIRGLPPVNKWTVEVTGKDGKKVKVVKARLTGRLDDDQSIRTVIGMLLHLNKTMSPRACLNAYAGVGYAGGDVPTHLAGASDRIKIVNKWLDCEAHLRGKIDLPAPPKGAKGPVKVDYTKVKFPSADFKMFIKESLKKAREFDLKAETIDMVLFPRNGVSEDGKPIWVPDPKVGYAYHAITDLVSKLPG